MFKIKNVLWKEDRHLQNVLEERVKRKYKKVEILVEVRKMFPHYAWSYRTLGERLRHFCIRYNDPNIDVTAVMKAVTEELKGTGQKLGYRAMAKVVQEKHGLNVPRDAVHVVMQYLDPAGLASRALGVKKKKIRGAFTSKGSNWTVSLDGHDKLCGYQKSQFPLAIYGGQDTYSGKMLFLRIWTSNNMPEIIGRYYYEHLNENKVLPVRIRVDHGSETGLMTAIHTMLHGMIDSTKTEAELINSKLLFGPSTENKIERWWRELHERMESFFKDQFAQLLENAGDYDPKNSLDRALLAYVFIPVIQNELDNFKDVVWNHSRGRKQKDKLMPTGIPDHMYENPEYYGDEQCGILLSQDQLDEIEEQTAVMDDDHDFLSPELRAACVELLPNPEEVNSYEAIDQYKMLKESISYATEQSSSSLQSPSSSSSPSTSASSYVHSVFGS